MHMPKTVYKSRLFFAVMLIVGFALVYVSFSGSSQLSRSPLRYTGMLTGTGDSPPLCECNLDEDLDCPPNSECILKNDCKINPSSGPDQPLCIGGCYLLIAQTALTEPKPVVHNWEMPGFCDSETPAKDCNCPPIVASYITTLNLEEQALRPKLGYVWSAKCDGGGVDGSQYCNHIKCIAVATSNSGPHQAPHKELEEWPSSVTGGAWNAPPTTIYCQ